jgi:indole-3-glycerol phosphate synthase
MSVGTRHSSTLLERILRHTREEVERRKQSVPLGTLEERLATGAGVRRSLYGALTAPGIGVIAEFKRRSPSAGELRHRPVLEEIVRAYERGGASALSVLTEGPHFEGSLEDLRVARQACELPVLRKDFIVDSYQLYEARAACADAVLLIVAALSDGELVALHEQARALELDVLVEVHDREELQSALSVGSEIVGINNRDLKDFSVDVERTFTLMSELPEGVVAVSESGIASAEQLRRLEEVGVQGVLVGEALMRASDPAAALRAMRGEQGFP